MRVKKIVLGILCLVMILGTGTALPQLVYAANPVMGDQTFIIKMDETFNGAATATDADSDPLVYTLNVSPLHGTFILQTDGQFSYTPNPAFTGTDSIGIMVTDGTNPATATYTFLVRGAITPDTIMSTPAVVSGDTSGYFVLASSPNDTSFSFECNLDAMGYAPCSSTFAYSGLSEGMHMLDVRAKDDLYGGLDPTPASFTWYINSTAPPVPVISSPVQGILTNNVTPIISGTSQSGSTVHVKLDGTDTGTAVSNLSGNWTWTPGTALTEGSHSVAAYASNYSGTGAEAAPLSFTVDTTAPSAPVITSPTNGSKTYDATPTVKGTAEALSTVNINLDGSTAGTVAADGSGNWTWTPGTHLAIGAHTLQASATDTAGNIGSNSLTLSFTVSRPYIPSPPLPEPRLSQLTAMAGEQELVLAPEFQPDQLLYHAETNEAEAQINVVRSSETFTLQLNGSSWNGEGTVELAEGDNKFYIAVIRGDGLKKQYELNIVRTIPEKTECLFVDLRADGSQSAICEAYALGIVKGTDERHFEPNRPITRAEFVAMLINMLQPDVALLPDRSFSDEDQLPAWAKQSILVASTVGIVYGFPDGSFQPQVVISRAEMAVMLARAGQWSVETGPTSYSDDAMLPDWARAEIKAALAHGVLTGRDDGTFAPVESTTRAEAAAGILLLRKERTH